MNIELSEEQINKIAKQVVAVKIETYFKNFYERDLNKFITDTIYDEVTERISEKIITVMEDKLIKTDFKEVITESISQYIIDKLGLY